MLSFEDKVDKKIRNQLLKLSRKIYELYLFNDLFLKVDWKTENEKTNFQIIKIETFSLFFKDISMK